MLPSELVNLKKYHPDMSAGDITEMYNSLAQFRKEIKGRLEHVINNGKLRAKLTVIAYGERAQEYVYSMPLEDDMLIVVRDFQRWRSIVWSDPEEGFLRAYDKWKRSIFAGERDEHVMELILHEHCPHCIENGFNPDYCKCTRHVFNRLSSDTSSTSTTHQS